MRVALVGLVLFVLSACASDDERATDAPASNIDAASGDGGAIDASGDGGVDAATRGDGVLCARQDQSCVDPTPECCDVTTGTDMCIAANGTCAGDRLACDGPEDCPLAQECCLYEGQGSRCIDEGICGTTSSISAEMCHVMTDCDQNEMCCGTAPGPALDLYSVCRTGPCPQ